MQEVYKAIGHVAGQDVTVLLLGESGTGKELVARAVYQHSRRADKPFLAINCAAIPDSLLESELFGHEKGAFTGAVGRKVGKAEMAHQGTLFLDEIGDLPLPLQGKILRLVQEKQFERVGGLQTLTVDVRVVAATNRDLQQAVAQREFREDLFFRLSVFPIEIPPLRRRRGDILPLAEAFLDRYAREMGRRNMTLSDEAKEALAEHRWPGNVRELQNCLERAVILCDGASILPEHLRLGASEGGPSLSDLIDLRQPLEQVSSRAAAMAEEEAIRLALRECPDRAAAAERLALTPAALTRRIKALGIEEG
jgi:transcriptional regulator with GAF, ATPase, and Fis domain